MTIHVIFSAHLDPVWMWPWTGGLDESLATARSACDRLAANPDLFYTQGEGWTLAMVQRADPALWRRICGFVEAGRWEIVNGWWTQPDCNFPSADGLRRHIETSLAWTQATFGVTPRCGFNPDSFGHCAILPEILRACGQDRYVFMRPQEHECALPARLFTWRTRPGGAGVTAFRIADSYLNGLDGGVWNNPLKRAVQALPQGVAHTMTFMGVGDHGGGPTERLVRWVRENRDFVPGARLEFSTITRFFDAVAAEGAPLPEVTGELQMHAVGCYSVVRSVKNAVRRAEHALVRAEAAAPEAERAALEAAWLRVAAHQFHDTLGGTCLPEAYEAVEDQLRGATALADETLVYAVRRQMATLPDDHLPRIVLANPGAVAFDGWCEANVYLEGPWKSGWRLVDVAGVEIAFQSMHSGAGNDPTWLWDVRRVLVRRRIEAGALDVLRLDPTQAQRAVPPAVSATPDRLSQCDGLSVRSGAEATVLSMPRHADLALTLHLIDDPSDTWSHGVTGYGETPLATACWGATQIVDAGPLMASWRQTGRIGASTLVAEWRVYEGSPAADLLLDVHWCETRKLLKLIVPQAGGTQRTDGTPGMALVRANDGCERPLQDWTQLDAVGVVCPDVYALDATPERARLTLLRSPFMAHHDPCPVGGSRMPRAVVADQGTHRFRFRFILGGTGPEALAAAALDWQRPLLTAELTRGMPARFTEYNAVDMKGR
jgi:alpha-mannosidase